MKTSKIKAKSPPGLEAKIRERVQNTQEAQVFTPYHFLDLGSRAAVDKALSRLVAKRVLRRVARGLYDVPRTHPRIGVLHATVDAIAKALAARHQWRLQPAGAYAANLLGLSEQVPMKVIFLTDGPSKEVRIGGGKIILKHTTTRNMATAGRVSGLVIQALRWIKQLHVEDRDIAELKRRLSPKDKECLVKDAPLAPAWIGEVMRRVAEAEVK